MRKTLVSLVGGLISFDHSSPGGQRNSDPKLIWGMSVNTLTIRGASSFQGELAYAQTNEYLVALLSKLAIREVGSTSLMANLDKSGKRGLLLR